MDGKRSSITVAEGDGIGPEIMAATLRILDASGANLDIHKVEVGEKVYLKGEKSGIAKETWDVIKASDAFLKAPITTPQGGGFKSLNVTIRTTLGLYANVRPCVAYNPFVKTKHPGMDLVIVRENEEDLYIGLEYRQTEESYHAIKLITQPASEKIIRYAFDYATTHNRKKVTCFVKDNILKLTDGVFHKIYDEIAKEYPNIEHDHWIVDIGAAKLADTPEAFDVVVMPNLYGDILSDVAAQIAGSVGLAGSANIGAHGAMFEAIHGSAPRRAGQNVANPSGLLLAAVLMLVHLEKNKAAELVHNAWLKTLEDGIHTYDIFKEGVSKQKVGTKEFAKAVIERLGQNPSTLKSVSYTATQPAHVKAKNLVSRENQAQKLLVGLDVFITGYREAQTLVDSLKKIYLEPLSLKMIGNRGTSVWPGGQKETSCGDTWRCRFVPATGKKEVNHSDIAALLQKLSDAKIDFTSIETLCTFDGVPGYTLSQDEQ
jgi:isocitrate dehydrogenase